MSHFVVISQTFSLAIGFALFWSLASWPCEKILSFLPTHYRYSIVESLQTIFIAVSVVALLRFHSVRDFFIYAVVFLLLAFLFLPNPKLATPSPLSSRLVSFVLGLLSYLVFAVSSAYSFFIKPENPLSDLIIKIIFWLYSVPFLGWVIGIVSFIFVATILFNWLVMILGSIALLRKRK